ncbi:MAG: hypothetical protein ABEH47_02525 [Haloferacaceae archaeon]
MRYDDLAAVGVLGVLAEQGPETLGGVRETLKHNFARYWGFSSGVLSPTIRELEEAGHVEASVREDEDAAADLDAEEYVYSITDGGYEHLRDLIREGLRDRDSFDVSQRSQVMVRLGFLHHLPEREQAAALSAIADGLRAEREKWEEVRRAHRESEREGAGYRGELTRLNVRMIDTFIEWIEGLDIRTFDEPATAE